MATLARENSYRLLPIHIVTGFLGSGKTTLLNRLLRAPDMRSTLVIVNEFGEIGVDHLLLQASTEDIVMLDGGCLCCAVRGDLLVTLQDMHEKRAQGRVPEFTQVLVETTGLADPAPILRTLLNDPFVAEHYRLDTVVATVDAVYGMQQLGEHPESVKQAALANHLVLTKTDLAKAKVVEKLRTRLRQLNPTAQFHDVQRDRFSGADLFSSDYYAPGARTLDVARWLRSEAYLSPLTAQAQRELAVETHRHDAYIRTFCIEYPEPLSWLVLERWLKQLTRLRGKDLLRVKGIAYTLETDLPVLIQGVQHIFQPPVTLDTWPDARRHSQIVFITRNIEKNVVEENLRALIRGTTPQEICAAALLLLGQR